MLRDTAIPTVDHRPCDLFPQFPGISLHGAPRQAARSAWSQEPYPPAPMAAEAIRCASSKASVVIRPAAKSAKHRRFITEGSAPLISGNIT